MADAMDALEQVSRSAGSQEERVAQYTAIGRSLTTAQSDVGHLNQFVQYILSNGHGAVVPVIEDLTEHIKGSPAEEEVLTNMLSAITPMLASFAGLDGRVRGRLSELYGARNDFHQAAVILQDIVGGSTGGNLSDTDKFEVYVRIARNYLEAGEPEHAAGYLSKAQYLRGAIEQPDPIVDIHYQLCQARTLDSSRRFLEAANRYFDVSREEAVDPADRLQCLSKALVCSVLASAGPARGQILRKLYNDERSRQLPRFPILDKVYHDRLLQKQEVDDFATELEEYAVASLPDGTTVLSRAVIDHNVLSVSKIYTNIRINHLAQILELDETKTESYTAKMISQNRLSARIDQIGGIVYFETTVSNEKLLKDHDGRAHAMLVRLDDIVSELDKRSIQIS